MTSKREQFFHQRVLTKLFPGEEGLESDSQEDEQQGNLTKETSVRTENLALHDVPYKGQKRKQDEVQDCTFPRKDDVSLIGKQSTSLHSSHLEAVEKRVPIYAPASVVDDQQYKEHKTTELSGVQECREKSTQGTVYPSHLEAVEKHVPIYAPASVVDDQQYKEHKTTELSGVHECREKSTQGTVYPSHVRLETVEKRVSIYAPVAVADEQQYKEHKTTDLTGVQECGEKSAQCTGSQLAESTEQALKLSKNQKRKMKKKRHKERIRSSGDRQTNPAPKEFSYETG